MFYINFKFLLRLRSNAVTAFPDKCIWFCHGAFRFCYIIIRRAKTSPEAFEFVFKHSSFWFLCDALPSESVPLVCVLCMYLLKMTSNFEFRLIAYNCVRFMCVCVQYMYVSFSAFMRLYCGCRHLFQHLRNRCSGKCVHWKIRITWEMLRHNSICWRLKHLFAKFRFEYLFSHRQGLSCIAICAHVRKRSSR